MLHRLVLLVGLALGVAACSGAAPRTASLSDELRSQIRISEVVIDTTAVGAETAGRGYPVAAVESRLQQTADAGLIGLGQGDRAARAVLTLDGVRLLSAAQAMLVGGESVMSGTVALVDARTGDTVMPAAPVSAGGGGWVMGGVIGAVSRDDPETEIAQMSTEFVSRSRLLIGE